MSNKKFSKLAVLSLLGVMSLAGCSSNASSDEIYAKPSTYDKSVITVKEGEGEVSIHNNLLKLIYDSMHENVASQVLEQILYKYSETIYGVFNKVIADKEKTSSEAEDVITLEEAATDTSAEHTKINAFIKAHKVYWHRNEKKEHITDAGVVIPEGSEWTPGDTERENVKSRYRDVNKSIAENMYRKSVKGSYTSNYFFDEYAYVKSLWKDGKKVDFASAKSLHDSFNESGQRKLPKVLVDYTIEEDEVFSKGLLHKSFYQAPGFTYIEDEIVPEIYKDLLVEQYLLDEEVSAVRTSNARKINAIKIEKYSGSSVNADALINHLVENIYSIEPLDNGHLRLDSEAIDEEYQKLFESYAKVSKGLYDEIQADPVAKQIVKDLQTGSAYDVYHQMTYTYKGVNYIYYEGTAYGDLIKDFERYHNYTSFDDYSTTLHNKFTDNGKISELEGLSRETLKISQERKDVTKGWYVSKSKPSLDGSNKINDILFASSVYEYKHEVSIYDEDNPDGRDEALINKNIDKLEGYIKLDGESETFVDGSDRYQKQDPTASTWTWKLRDSFEKGENKYMCSINGAYFLKFDKKAADADPRKDIVFTGDDSAYYVVNVVEATKDIKLRADATNSYAKTRGISVLNEIISEVTQKTAETGSYASLSKEYWLKKMSLTYHDQKIYDYFKSNYPDLFE